MPGSTDLTPLLTSLFLSLNPKSSSCKHQDRPFQARTIPVRLGTDRAMTIIAVSLGAAVLLSLVVFALSPLGLGIPYRLSALAVGGYMLLYPAYQLHRTRRRSEVMALFNRASYYPMALFIVVLVRLLNA